MPEWPGCESDPRNFTEYFPFTLDHLISAKNIKKKKKKKEEELK